MNINEKTKLLDIVKDIARKVSENVLNDKNVESISYGTIVAINTDGTYNVKIAGSDAICGSLLNKSITPILSVGDNVIITYNHGNIGNGFISEKMGVDDRGAVAYYSQSLTTSQQTQARTNIGLTTSQLFLLTHPVGSLYWSSKSINPATLFGGVWTQITDTFILAAGTNHAANADANTVTTAPSTQGEETHKLTVEEMPNHKHSFDLRQNNGTATGHISEIVNAKYRTIGSTSYTGGNQPHNNMPPYLVRYCWERTA